MLMIITATGVVLILLIIFIKALSVKETKFEPSPSSSNEEIHIPFEFKVVSGNEALETCNKLREEKSITPIIFGGPNDAKQLFEAENEESPQEIIEKSKTFDIKTFINLRIEEDPEYYSDQELVGEWPKSFIKHQDGIRSHTDILTNKPLQDVYIGLIPTTQSFEALAYIGFGGWNECPNTEDHVGIMRYWNEKYGVEIVSITSDVIECIVKNPPSTKEEALELAKEQFIYCPDIVTQGTDTIAALAASLLNANYWFFWWD